MRIKKFSGQDLAKIFRLARKTIRKIVGEHEWQRYSKAKEIGQLKKEFSEHKDDYHFSQIVWVIFCQGAVSDHIEKRINTIWEYLRDYRRIIKIRRSGKEEQYIREMMSDNEMYRHEIKIRASIDNAFRFAGIVKKYPSQKEFGYREYVLSFDPWRGDGVDKLVNDMAKRFVRFRRISASHFLVRYGFPIIKPDMNMKRTFFRIGLITNDRDDQGCILVARQMAEAAGVGVATVDSLVLLGMKKGNEVCGNKPDCNRCYIRPYCRYYEKIYLPKFKKKTRK